MDKEKLFECVQAFSALLDIRYHIVLGRAGKTAEFVISFDKADCYHLMGIHYLQDRTDRRGRNTIFDELLSSEEIRDYYATSDFWTDELVERILCTTSIEKILDDENTVFRYSQRRLQFFSKISAEYRMEYSGDRLEGSDISDTYLFIDKRSGSDDRYCKSVFAKGDRDYTRGQTKWTLLYKEKEHVSSNKVEILYQHKSYRREGASDIE